MIEIMEPSEIRTLLHDRNLQVVSDGSGVKYQTLRRLKKIEEYSPKLSDIIMLTDYFKGDMSNG